VAAARIPIVEGDRRIVTDAQASGYGAVGAGAGE
jgi:hypothetical protein